MSSSLAQTLGQLTYSKALGISILIGGFYYFNLYDDGSKLQEQIKQVQALAQQEEEKKKETDRVLAEEIEIKRQVGALAEKFKEITAKFPINLKSDEIITNLNSLAKTANVRVVSVKKENINTQELYEEVPLSVDLSGTFNNLLLMMYNVASLQRVTNVGDFEFTNVNNEYDGILKLTTRVIGYKYKKPTPKPVEAQSTDVSGGT